MTLLSHLGRLRNTGLLLIRLGVGLSFILLHGYPKLMGGPETWAMVGQSMGNLGIEYFPTFWGFSAGLIETLGGVLLIVGFLFRPTCILLAFIMLVAMVQHLSAGDGWGVASHALEVGMVFVGLLFVGPGKYSIDKR